MRTQINIAKKFPKHLFWDMDASRLSVKEDKALIIPRALFATTQATFERDIQRLEEIYSKKEIVSILKNTKERISNEVCILVTKRYNAKPFLRYSL
ncbi:hypothetical protein [uncultured Christiangramia sp.]|uniref:DUF6922 domain-containing protein n=1 Tax=Christiangramia sp. 3-2217-3z TaxID=3417564 RepID=UPI00262B0B83|nr:hypothetical protein [uncultured Christiangramia sp.]